MWTVGKPSQTVQTKLQASLAIFLTWSLETLTVIITPQTPTSLPCPAPTNDAWRWHVKGKIVVLFSLWVYGGIYVCGANHVHRFWRIHHQVKFPTYFFRVAWFTYAESHVYSRSCSGAPFSSKPILTKGEHTNKNTRYSMSWFLWVVKIELFPLTPILFRENTTNYFRSDNSRILQSQSRAWSIHGIHKLQHMPVYCISLLRIRMYQYLCVWF